MTDTDRSPRSRRTTPRRTSTPDKFTVRNLDFYYGTFHALTGISVDIKAHAITAFIGPSGCGKSTFLRCLNRMNDLIPGTRVDGQDRCSTAPTSTRPGVDPVDLRRRVGMIFQQPNPFPMSVYDNVAFGPRLQGVQEEVRARRHRRRTRSSARTSGRRSRTSSAEAV